jgi:hypothetical protein
LGNSFFWISNLQDLEFLWEVFQLQFILKRESMIT